MSIHVYMYTVIYMYIYLSILACMYTVHVLYIRTVYMYLLDISRQLARMKLGRREKYQPIQYCWAGCLGYPVHTCHLPIDIQQIYCSAQTGQHSRLRCSCCPVWALQHTVGGIEKFPFRFRATVLPFPCNGTKTVVQRWLPFRATLRSI